MFVITLAIATAAAVFGFVQSRSFVRNRLRFVEAVQSSAAPLVAGVAASVVAVPVVGILPFVGGFTALLFGASVGMGVASGAKDVRERRYLP